MASDPFIQRHIRNLPLFERLTNPQIELVANAAEVIQLQPGQFAFQQGQPTRGMMLFVAGRGVLTRFNANNIEEPIGSVEQGQYINETALYSTTRETANLRIVQPAVIILIPRGRFVNLLSHLPELRSNLRVETSADHREAPRHLFKGQRDDETVLHIYRRHWWTFGRWLWLPVVFAIVAFTAAVLLAPINGIVALVAAGFGVIVPGVIIAYFYYEWQDDSVIVTNQRVVRVWNTLFTFENTINEIPLDRVLEISSEIPPGDAFARLLNYGNVAIKTSGESANMFLTFVPSPMQVQRTIFAQREQVQQLNAQRRQAQIRSDIERVLGRQAGQTQAVGGIAPVEPNDDSDSTIGLSFLRTKYINMNGDIIYRKHASVWFFHIFPPLLVILGGIALFFLSLIPTFTFSGAAGLGLSLLVLLLGASVVLLGRLGLAQRPVHRRQRLDHAHPQTSAVPAKPARYHPSDASGQRAFGGQRRGEYAAEPRRCAYLADRRGVERQNVRPRVRPAGDSVGGLAALVRDQIGAIAVGFRTAAPANARILLGIPADDRK
ncbi:MAG: Crp/Fnr family transcriptional regulator [Chloroflexi bacterium]|nr:Crp/Fnr family transcriptional regulator [Chloroflexota bacterium]